MRDIISYDSIFEAKPESRKDLRALARDVRLLLGPGFKIEVQH